MSFCVTVYITSQARPLSATPIAFTMQGGRFDSCFASQIHFLSLARETVPVFAWTGNGNGIRAMIMALTVWS